MVFYYGSHSKLKYIPNAGGNYKSTILPMKEYSTFFSSTAFEESGTFPSDFCHLLTHDARKRKVRRALVAGVDGQTWSSCVCGGETSD